MIGAWRWVSRAKGPVHTSLGQRPRNSAPQNFISANGAIHPCEAVGDAMMIGGVA